MTVEVMNSTSDGLRKGVPDYTNDENEFNTIIKPIKKDRA